MKHIIEGLCQIVLELGQLRCEDCNEIRYLLLPDVEKIIELLPNFQSQIKQYENLFQGILAILKEQKDKADDLKKQIGFNAETQIWNILSELGHIIYPFPSYIHNNEGVLFEVLVSAVDNSFNAILHQLSSVEQPDTALQKAIAEIIGRSELYDQTEYIHLWWKDYFERSKQQLDTLIKGFRDMKHIEVSDCDDQAYEDIARLLRYISNDLDELLPNPNDLSTNQAPSYQRRDQWLVMLNGLKDKSMQLKRQ
ncbi:MAG: hypothetical protein IPP79_20680 [Chitinophagaceae bacterium]|nr:hypothetical protein [Chitinophagaceae bacterium]